MTDKPKTTAPEPFLQHTELLRLPGPRAEELLTVEGNQEQPLIEKTNNSIAEQEAERNEECVVKTADVEEKASEAMYLPENHAADTNKPRNGTLSTVSMSELYDTVYPPRMPVMDGLLYSGTYLFVGAPKVGKSFFMAQLAYHVATGLELWDYPVHQGTVLYLALEDDYARLQHRLSRMFGIDGTEKLHFAIQSRPLSDGLGWQLTEFVKEHNDTKLIIIDTLQKIREAGGDKNSYASDYEIIAMLKTFTDKHGLCLLLVHHTRKMDADDSFDMISGTNGLLGAADGAFVMRKKKRTDNTATLDIVGRDQPDQELTIEFDRERCVWNFQKSETELWKQPPDPLLEAVAAILTESNEWSGTPSELIEKLPDIEMQANVLTRKLNVSAERLWNDYGIRYESRRTHNGREVLLNRLQGTK